MKSQFCTYKCRLLNALSLVYMAWLLLNIARIKEVSLLIVRSQWWLSWIQVLNCLKCKQFHASSHPMSCLCHGLCICLCLCLCYCLSNCLLVGQVMSPHHSDHMSQRSQVSKIALWRCSLNVFVIVIVIVIVFVFVIVFLLVRSCPLITLIKCLKVPKSPW